jgi:hypothetical protein
MFYVFNIKESIYRLYQDNPSSLYKILENIYFMHIEEVDYGFNLFKQITDKIKVDYLNNQIYIKLHKDLVYSKMDDSHVINDLYHDEVSILKIKNSRILLESNKSYSSFFKILYDINNKFFICDFKEKDFFFIDNIIDKVKI